MKDLIKYLHDYGTSSLDVCVEIADEEWRLDFNDKYFNTKKRMVEMSARLKNALKEFAKEHQEEIKNAGD